MFPARTAYRRGNPRVSRQTPQANPARARKRVRARKPSASRRAASPAKAEAATPPAEPVTEADLKAQLALLADPAAIAKGAATKSNSRRNSPARADRPAQRASAEPTAQSTVRSETPAPAPAEALGWQHRPLVQSKAPLAKPTLPAPPSAERALAAELREARATLSIARETTQLQRDEITRLRAAVATGQLAVEAASATASVQPEIGGALAERSQLRGRILSLESELERAGLERAELHRTMAASQQELVERSRRLAAIEERFEVQEQALEQTRRHADQERRRHTEAQALLERLRATLRGVELEQPDLAIAAHEADSEAIAAPPAMRAVPATVIAAPVVAAPVIAAPSAASASSARAPIFEVWLAEQVRRNFGPLGIDSTSDLLREPLARRARPNGPALPILLVGRGVAATARPLAEALLRSGAPSFVVHVADPGGTATFPARDDDPLRGILERCAFPERPEALSALLRELAPAAVVAQDFLTWQPDVTEWLSELRTASASGTCLVFLEQTGLGQVAPSAALAAVGERIWELLPERYTREPGSGAPVASFREAFARRATPPCNELLRRLREGFELELCAQFGFLAEAFVSGPIAGCFDVGNARDERFLKQIADVDERRLEAGSASALHLIARIDPEAPR